MNLTSVILILLFYCVYLTKSNKNCSALQSYVQVYQTNNEPNGETFTSSQALFPPHKYYIPKTELVQLESTDDPCDEDSVSTDITDKVVLLFSDPSECSDHYQVYVAEAKGARAVLMVSTDATVSNIIDDDNLWDSTTIPMRGITLTKGTSLSNTLTSGETVSIEFGCLGKEYPNVICALDKKGFHPWLDGDYQIQVGETHNDHPFWVKEGYTFFMMDQYLYLDNANGDDDWFWAITEDKRMRNERLILAVCTDANIHEPSDCTMWNTTAWNFYGEPDEFTTPIMENDAIELSDELCSVSDLYWCIKSDESNLAGLQGTYRLYNPNTPYWFREMDDCDNAPGVMQVYVQRNGLSKLDWYHIIWDPMDGWIVAYCKIGTFPRDERPDNETLYRPDWCESKWRTIVDGSLDYSNVANDSSFTIEYDTICDGEYDCAEGEAIPSELCMSKNSIAHSFLEGSLTETGYIGEQYGTKEYQRNEPLYYQNQYVDVYLWYFGELQDTRKWWILSSNNMSNASQENSTYVWAYLPCSLENVAQCTAKWNFFWLPTDDEDWAAFTDWHHDPEFSIDEDECPFESTIAGDYTDEYDYVCVGLDEDLFEEEANLDADDFMGGYEINRTMIILSGNKPHWKKPINDDTKKETFIFYDAFFGFWQIGYSLHNFQDTVLVCMDDAIYPQDCTEWYDEYNQDLGSIISLDAQDCTSNDLLTVSDDIGGSTNALEVIGITLAVILILCCCLIIVYWYDKKNKGRAEIVSQKDLPSGRVTKGGDVELEQQVDDNQPLATGGGVTGGMDMSPLNPNEGNDTIDADEPNIDDEEEDGLIDADNITANPNDEDVIPKDDDDDSNEDE